VTRRLPGFAFWFFALSAPLAWLWFEWGRSHYVHLVLGVVDAVLGTSKAASDWGGSAAAPRFITVVPFLVLMLVTPGLRWRRRLLGAVGGLALLVLVHALLLIVVDVAQAEFGRGRQSIRRFFPFLILADGAPLLLWLFLARSFVAQALPGLAEPTRPPAPAAPPEAPAQPSRLRRFSFPLLLACFFLSGLAALVYETAWTREFAFVFGTSDLAVATVLAAYMGGLAAGAALAGRLAGRLRRPVLVYGLLELAIAVSALLVPRAIDASRALYVVLFGGSEALRGAEGLATALFYLVCSFLILLVPTALMGATLPLLARHAVRHDRELGRRVGLLYAANTAGAVAGTAVAAFLLLPSLGLRYTIWSAAALNALVFLLAWGLARVSEPLRAEPRAPAAAGVARSRWMLALICVSGAVSFGYEVLWVRLLSHVIGGSVYAFATMLASFLLGIAAGSALAGRWATGVERAARGFALAQLLVGALSLGAFLLVDAIPATTAGLAAAGWSKPVGDVVAGMLTLFPSALVIGATFPLAVRVFAGSGASPGAASARVYAFNTLGCIVGSIAAGFLLIPLLGFQGTLAACVGVNLVLAGVSALLWVSRPAALAGVAACGLVLLLVAPPSPPWRILRSSPLNASAASGEVAYFGVGRSATVLLLASEGGWQLRTNGLPEARIEPPGVWHNRSALEHWLGVLPVLARPDLRSLLMVGLGGGRALEVVPETVERIEVVELEAEVVAANREVGALRWRDPLADPRLRLHVNDARNTLLLTQRRFDAIVSQPSHPWLAGASHLYTREFFELARSRLVEGGVFVQWIGLAFVDPLLFRSLLATLAGVFEHTQVYQPGGAPGVLFLASDAPLAIASSARRALSRAPAALEQVGLRTAEDVFAQLILDTPAVRKLARGVPINRDDRNLLQARSPWIRERSLVGGLQALVGDHDPAVAWAAAGLDGHYLVSRLIRPRARRVVETFRSPGDREAAEAVIALAANRRKTARRRASKALLESPGQAWARAVILEIDRDVGDDGLPADSLDGVERLLLQAWSAERSGAGEGVASLDSALAALPPLHPLEPAAQRLRVRWRLAGGDAPGAREALEILDRRLLGYRASGEDLLLRAQASSLLGDPAAVLDTLGLLVPRLRGDRSLARESLRLARSLSLPAELEPQRARLLSRLAPQVRSRRGGGPS
jgi:spermidine synthase